ncbi:MAG: hypothetical protein D3910_28685 [Candidatus Electrothrix sp. ATG2]|nr:hypothetical protein [Candidatus Electrothrix sp. ATG2]
MIKREEISRPADPISDKKCTCYTGQTRGAALIISCFVVPPPKGEGWVFNEDRPRASTLDRLVHCGEYVNERNHVRPYC